MGPDDGSENSREALIFVCLFCFALFCFLAKGNAIAKPGSNKEKVLFLLHRVTKNI